MVEEDEDEDEDKDLFACVIPKSCLIEKTDGNIPLSHVMGEEDMFIKEQAAADAKKDTPICDAKTEIKIYMSRKLYLIIFYSLLLVL